MSIFQTIVAGEYDDRSPVTGLDGDAAIPVRDSLMEKLRERDCYLYELIFRTQPHTYDGDGLDGYVSPATTDTILYTAVQHFTIPTPDANVPNDGIFWGQTKHKETVGSTQTILVTTQLIDEYIILGFGYVGDPITGGTADIDFKISITPPGEPSLSVFLNDSGITPSQARFVLGATLEQ